MFYRLFFDRWQGCRGSYVLMSFKKACVKSHSGLGKITVQVGKTQLLMAIRAVYIRFIIGYQAGGYPLLRESRKPGIEESRRYKSIAMKKIFIAFFAVITITAKAQTQEDELLQEFINSTDFSWFLTNSQFSSNGEIGLNESFVYYERTVVNGTETNVPFLNINFFQLQNGQKKIVGQIQAIKVRNDYHGLPRDSRYLMLYRNFLDYNHLTQSGVIKIYDLNYEEYLVSVASISSGVVDNVVSNTIPEDIATRNGLISGRHYCDTNGNGNVTLGECYNCMMTACMSNPECQALCVIANMFIRRCTISILTSCAIISVIY